MAKINLEFDTLTKECSVTMDGEEMDDCIGVYCSINEEGKSYIEVVCNDSEEESGITTHTRVMASELSNDKRMLKTEASTKVELFPQKIEEKVIHTVAEWFKKNRRNK